MTTERAAEILQSLLNYRLIDCYPKDETECLRVAIAALKVTRGIPTERLEQIAAKGHRLDPMFGEVTI